MTLPNEQGFKRIADISEKQRIFFDLCQSKGDVIAKRPDPESFIFVLKPNTFLKNKLNCSFRAQGAQDSVAKESDIFISFMLGGEKYFMQSSYKSIGAELLLDTDAPIFHLQRRDDYRLKIPNRSGFLFEISSVNGKIHKLSIPIADLSAGGCLLYHNNKTKFEIGDQVMGHLFLTDRRPIDITGVIRHSRQSKSQEYTGIQFTNLTDIQKNKISALVMDLYREFFLRH